MRKNDSFATVNEKVNYEEFTKQTKCAKCSKYEKYCENCDRYEPIDNYEGWCGSTKVSARNWCSSWR